jgi:nitroimidazol reductase NimA-like FMN-containing flavoprotein (pyridoxamine 5'-phosphate oxidase superfamily)
MMRENPSVCLQVDHIVDLASWRSVIVWGIFHELHGEEASSALQRIMRRMLAWTDDLEGRPPPSFKDVNSETGHRSVVSNRDAVVGRIEVTEMTGCYEQR